MKGTWKVCAIVDDYRLPEPVERHLRNQAGKATSPGIKDCALRLLDAKCSRQAFGHIAARLEDDGLKNIDLLLELVADSALMAGGTDHQKIRSSAKALETKKTTKTAKAHETEPAFYDLFQAAIDAATEAVNAYAEVCDHLNNGLDAGALGDMFSDEHERTFADLIWWASQAQSALNQNDSVSALKREHSRAISGRKFSPWAAFYHDFITRLEDAIKLHQLSDCLSLKDSEVAGLGAAAIASWKDRSPISRTGKTIDQRSEKIRTARTSQVGK